MPLAKKAFAGTVAVGLLALMVASAAIEPDAADPATLPAAAPLAEQPRAPAKAPISNVATGTAEAAKPTAAAPKAVNLYFPDAAAPCTWDPPSDRRSN